LKYVETSKALIVKEKMRSCEMDLTRQKPIDLGTAGILKQLPSVGCERRRNVLAAPAMPR
jgi:hypothetical protein